MAACTNAPTTKRVHTLPHRGDVAHTKLSQQMRSFLGKLGLNDSEWANSHGALDGGGGQKATMVAVGH